jgi:chaperone modulatory protein CbpM
MQTDELILAEKFCSYYKVEYSFLDSLQQVGLVEITSVEEADYISQSELQKLEQLTRLHYDLDINLEGIDAIANLLERVKQLQSELAVVKNRLKLYEEF